MISKKTAWCLSAVLLIILFFYFSFDFATPFFRSSLSLTNRELLALLQKARDGDADASMRLSDHYMFLKSDNVNGLRWREHAALLGNEKAKEWLRSFLKHYSLAQYRVLTARTNETQEAGILEVLEIEKFKESK